LIKREKKGLRFGRREIERRSIREASREIEEREFDKEREKGVAIWEKRNREEKH
jgi:hypothetical protein